MLITENEAHTMWCPFVRVEGSNRLNNSLTDGFEGSPAPYHCIGNKCMMWRKNHVAHLKAGAAKGAAAHGHCGLAGAVEIDTGW